MNRTKLTSRQIYIALVCLTSAMVVLPIIIFGIPESVDLPQHFKFARLFHESFVSGDYFPGWAGSENFGYGDTGIRFYPPLEYYFLAFTRLIVGNWYDATWLTFVFWAVLGSLGVYLWARHWFSPKESAVAACLYSIVPFHLHHLYVSFNNYSEFAAASVLGFCFAFTTGIFRREKTSDVLGLAISFALLILLHLPSTIIGAASLSVYALMLVRKENLFRTIAKCAAAIAAALAATAFYWVVLIGEMKWLNHTTERFSTGYYDFDKAFSPLIYHSDQFPGTVKIVDATVFFTLALYVAAILIYFFYKRKGAAAETDPAAKIFRTVLPLGLLAYFMATPLSRPLWESIGLLQRVQFPTRWMNVVALSAALVAAAAVHFLLKADFHKNRIGLYTSLSFALIILLFNGVYILHPTSFVPIPREKFESRLATLPEVESFDCWWTIWARREAFEVKEKVLAGNRIAEIGEWQSEKRTFTVSAGEPTTARVATFYYPRWQATVNGASVEIEKDANGVMLVRLPAEKAVVEISFREPAANRIAALVSIFAWLFLSLAFLFLKYKNFTRSENADSYFVAEEFPC